MFGPSIAFYEFLKIFVAGYYSLFSILIYIFLFLDRRIFSWNPSMQIVFYGFLGLIIGLIIDSSDPLLRCKKTKENKFFLGNMPSNYLVEICENCKDKNSCKNVLDKESSIPAWFYIYDNIVSEYLRNFVFMISAQSRVVFYLKYISSIFLLLSLISTLIVLLKTYYGFGDMIFLLIELEYKLLFALSFLIVYLIITLSNRPTDSPKGIWKKWRNLNRDLKYWVKINKETYKKVICEQSIPYEK